MKTPCLYEVATWQGPPAEHISFLSASYLQDKDERRYEAELLPSSRCKNNYTLIIARPPQSAHQFDRSLFCVMLSILNKLSRG